MLFQIMRALALAHKHTTCAEGGHGAGRFARGEEKRRSAAPSLMMLGAAARAASGPSLRKFDKILGGSVSQRSFKSGYQDNSPALR
jgi:hypothetical protein